MREGRALSEVKAAAAAAATVVTWRRCGGGGRGRGGASVGCGCGVRDAPGVSLLFCSVVLCAPDALARCDVCGWQGEAPGRPETRTGRPCAFARAVERWPVAARGVPLPPRWTQRQTRDTRLSIPPHPHSPPPPPAVTGPTPSLVTINASPPPSIISFLAPSCAWTMKKKERTARPPPTPAPRLPTPCMSVNRRVGRSRGQPLPVPSPPTPPPHPAQVLHKFRPAPPRHPRPLPPRRNPQSPAPPPLTGRSHATRTASPTGSAADAAIDAVGGGGGEAPQPPAAAAATASAPAAGTTPATR